jgi:hypothetical protein
MGRVLFWKRSFCAAIALLVICTVVPAAKNKPWPAKGDTVYVSAYLVQVHWTGPIFFLEVPPIVGPVPSCEPSRVKKANPKRGRWEIRALIQKGYHNYSILKGPWLSRMHRTAEECEAYFKEYGQPDIERSGAAHRIITQFDPARMQIIQDMIDSLLKEGFVTKWNCDLNEVWIEPSYWAAMNCQRRSDFTASLAMLCESKGGGGWVVVKDAYTGQRLAKWEASGLKVY